MLIIKKIKDYKSSLLNSIIKIILQVKKGLTLKDYLYILLKARVAILKAANNTASKHKKYKKK
jgi:hypothetical protein